MYITHTIVYLGELCACCGSPFQCQFHDLFSHHNKEKLNPVSCHAFDTKIFGSIEKYLKCVSYKNLIIINR